MTVTAKHIRELEMVNSQDKEWLQWYYHKNWAGLNKLVAKESDPKLNSWKQDCIQLARNCRRIFMEKFPEKVFWGRGLILEKSEYPV